MSFETPKGKMTFRKEDHQAMQACTTSRSRWTRRSPGACPSWCARSSPRDERSDPQQALTRCCGRNCVPERTAPPSPLREGLQSEVEGRVRIRVASRRGGVRTVHRCRTHAARGDVAAIADRPHAGHRVGSVVRRLHGHAAARGVVVGVSWRRCRRGGAVLLCARRRGAGDHTLPDTRQCAAGEHAGGHRQTMGGGRPGGSDVQPHHVEGLSVLRLERHGAGAGAGGRPEALLRGLRAGGEHRVARRRAGRTRHADRRLRQRLRSPRPAVRQRLRCRRRWRTAAPTAGHAGAAQRRCAAGPLRRVRPARVRRRRPGHGGQGLAVRPARLHGRHVVPAARGAARLRPERRFARRRVPAAQRLQPLGRQQPHRHAVPADQQRRAQRLLGLVGLHRRRLCATLRAAGGRHRRDGRATGRHTGGLQRGDERLARVGRAGALGRLRCCRRQRVGSEASAGGGARQRCASRRRGHFVEGRC